VLTRFAGIGPARQNTAASGVSGGSFGSGGTGRESARRPIPANDLVVWRLLEHWPRPDHAGLIRLAEHWPAEARLVYDLIHDLDARPKGNR